MTDEVVILSAVRTPIGSFCGGFASLSAHELGAVAINEAVIRSKVDPEEIDEVFMGQTLTAGQGQNPARQASLNAGLAVTVPATNVNMICGSGLKAVILGAQSIKAGDNKVVVAGGQESMSRAHHSIYLRGGTKMGDAAMTDTMIKDGLTDAFLSCHMGITGENVAKQWKVTREEQDQFALKSQQNAAVAQKNKRFESEIVPVTVKGRQPFTVTSDEYPKNDSAIEKLRALQPVFLRDGTGTVTAGNASGLNDGAAALVLSSNVVAREQSLKPLARIVSYASAGVEPSVMGTGPIPAIKAALKKANWTLGSVDYFELNEAFASQSIAVVKDLGIPSEKVNKNGGAIALGHPIGASGARVLVTLINVLKQNSKTRGLAALCVGGGQGVAICIELL